MNAARAAMQEGGWALDNALAVTVYVFPAARLQADLDNLLKPILDAMTRCVYLDDSQIEGIVIQKFEPGKSFEFSRPTPVLSDALASAEPAVYIRLTEDLNEELS